MNKIISNKLASVGTIAVIVLGAIVPLIFASSTALAAAAIGQSQSKADYTVLAPLPCIPTPDRKASDGTDIPAVACPSGDMQNVPTVTFQTYVQYAINLLIALSAVAAVFMIVWGGFEYMTSVSVSGKSGGLDRARNAVYGLILVLCSYIILRTVDPRLVNIPSTLVPQLTLKTSLTQNSAMDMLDQMQSDANKYTVKAQEYVQSAQTAKTKVADLQTQLDAAEAEYNQAHQDADLDAQDKAQAKMADLNNQITTVMADQALATHQAITNSIISNASLAMSTEVSGISKSTWDKIWSAVTMSDSSDALLKEDHTAKTAIAAETDSRIQELKKIQGDTSQQQISVLDEQQYANAVIDMKAQVEYAVDHSNDPQVAKDISSQLDTLNQRYSVLIKTQAERDQLNQATLDNKAQIAKYMKNK